MKDKFRRLRDFASLPPLHCMHCEMLLPKTTRVELYGEPDNSEYFSVGKGNYLVAECPQCRRMTPFKLEAAA